ncbi:uncharacterized protein ACO6RY_07165 [Pungitius sinensis]
MGSTGSRPRLRSVAPCDSLQADEPQLVPRWTLPALPVSAEQPAALLGQRKTPSPPRRQDVTTSSLSGQGLQRWGCPPVFYYRPDRGLLLGRNDSGRTPGGPDSPESKGSSGSPPPKCH